MVKAHSLLYAIYICLLVSIICGGMLYFFNLYSILNLHYNLQEELYLQNRSTINFALGSKLHSEEITDLGHNGIESRFFVKPYGLLNVLTATTFFKTDTVTSTHFVGEFTKNKTALYISNLTQKISYHGDIKVGGDVFLPSDYLSNAYLTNEKSSLEINGKKGISSIRLPEMNSKFSQIFDELKKVNATVSEEHRIKDSLIFNSFSKPTVQINVPNTLGKVIIKGNVILKNKDSITISKNAILEDVIVISPKIHIEEGFIGTVQFFATKGIFIAPKVTLNYPSAIVVKNELTQEEAKIEIEENFKLFGTIMMFGNTVEFLNTNSVCVKGKSLIVGNIYSTGSLDLSGTVYGSVYTNKVMHKTNSSIYENVIANFTIDLPKKPNYFINLPLFEENNVNYGIVKKVK